MLFYNKYSKTNNLELLQHTHAVQGSWTRYFLPFCWASQKDEAACVSRGVSGRKATGQSFYFVRVWCRRTGHGQCLGSRGSCGCFLMRSQQFLIGTCHQNSWRRKFQKDFVLSNLAGLCLLGKPQQANGPCQQWGRRRLNSSRLCLP